MGKRNDDLNTSFSLLWQENMPVSNFQSICMYVQEDFIYMVDDMLNKMSV